MRGVGKASGNALFTSEDLLGRSSEYGGNQGVGAKLLQVYIEKFEIPSTLRIGGVSSDTQPT